MPHSNIRLRFVRNSCRSLPDLANNGERLQPHRSYHMPLDYETVTPARSPVPGRFCLVAFGGAGFGLLVWCVLDFMLVRFDIRGFDWLMLLFPFAVGAAGAGLLRQSDGSARVGLAVLAAILASIIAVALILFLGIPFHFAIGGAL